MTTPENEPENGTAGHDCNDDPGPIHSYFAAMAFLAMTSDCSAEHCKIRARAEQALAQAGRSDRSRTCLSGLETTFAHRICARLSDHATWDAASTYVFCRLDPGHLGRGQAQILLRLHRHCDPTRCRLKLRALQAFAPQQHQCPPPRCPIPDKDIAVAVADYQATQWVLDAVKVAFYRRQPESVQAMTAATAEFATARRRRDALFLRALPPDGTIPVTVIKKFRITYFDIHRLVPTFTRPLALR
ncbi:hypothetical protein ACFU44_15925 [Nocardia rhizosphaerihabitans]|uniref:hypothetical protein n=1 Tax=Nocardia rhizosphaerihabitans TaxID=1691570 RepID=UPI00366D8684